MSSDPVSGNQNFTSINTQAKQLSEVDIPKVSLFNTEIQTIKTDFLWETNQPTLLDKKLYSVTGNSSSNFTSLIGGSAQFLNYQPGKPATTEDNGIPLVLPRGAVVVGAYMIDESFNGTLLDVGFALMTGAIPTPGSNDIFAASPQAIINQGCIVTSIPPTVSGMGGAGVIPVATPTVPSVGTTGVIVTPSTNVTTSNGLRVTIYYMV